LFYASSVFLVGLPLGLVLVTLSFLLAQSLLLRPLSFPFPKTLFIYLAALLSC
jgi:hypothetical protein